ETRPVQSIVKAIIDTFKSVLKFDRNQVLLAPSAGIVEDISHYSETSHIIRDSHIAAQHALNTEGASSHIFSPSSYSHVVEKLELETRLCEALEHDEFLNHYQPIYDLASRQLVAFESLARWQPPGRELAYPSLFIPHMETTGSIVSLGTKVLDLACTQMQQWAQLGYQHLSISINLSARQIAHASLLDDIQACLDKYEITPEQLKFEVTESVLMEHIYLASNVIDRLHNLGMTVSIDDFGTGYSSLSYLQKLPFDGLKVDRSFIQDIGTDGENTEILDAVINLAHSLNMTVTAEGIETLEQLDVLRELGCDYGQGYLLGMPSEAKDCSLGGDWHSTL
ncbi:MAG: EAL domain-containing protein, partial [Cyanobacteria bacterium J06597_1]